MKIYCESCNGTGEMMYGWTSCNICWGKGYTEDKAIKHEIEVGRATIKAFKNTKHQWRLADITEWELFSVDELLEWAEEESNG